MLLLASAAARVTSHLVVVGWHWAALPLISLAAVIPAAASRVPCHSPRLAKLSYILACLVLVYTTGLLGLAETISPITIAMA